MERLRLRKIIPISFNKSEATNFDEAWASKEHGPLLRTLGPHDCVCMASKGGDQLVFVNGWHRVSLVNGVTSTWEVLSTRRMRIRRGPGLANQYEPKMLANYAREVGIELVGLKLFEEYLAEKN